MKRSCLMLIFLAAVASIQGCKWDSGDYDMYVTDDHTVVTCPPGNIITKTTSESGLITTTINYVNINSIDCYADKITKHDTDGDISQCINDNMACISGSTNTLCEDCEDYIEDLRICIGLQDYGSEFFEQEKNDKFVLPQFTFIGMNSISGNKIQLYTNSASKGLCPKDYPICTYVKDNGVSKGSFGCISDCPWNFVKCNGICIEPSTNSDFCGAKGLCNSDDPANDNYKGNRCATGQKCALVENEYKCIIECLEGQIKCHDNTGDVCINPLTDSQFCGAKNSCTEMDYETCDSSKKKICDDGHCKCMQSYKLCNDECVDINTDANNCGDCGNPLNNEHICTQNQMCSNGVCHTVKCEENQVTCVTSDDIECKSMSVDNCGACGLACNQVVPVNAEVDISKGNQGCDNGICQYKCKDGFTNCPSPESGLNCVDTTSDFNHCGGCDSDNKCRENQFCNNGHCEQSACTNNGCSLIECENTPEQCGKGCINCKVELNAEIASCNVGQCIAEKCAVGYHFEDDLCIPNTTTQCAPQDKNSDIIDCTSKLKPDSYDLVACHEGQCLISCKTNYHLKENECLNDSEEFCHGVVCINLEGWNSGVCNEAFACDAQTCKNGYHIEEASGYHKCELDTANDCTQEHIDCTSIPGWSSATCSESGCIALACKPGYHLDDNQCKEDDVLNCGSLGAACHINNSAEQSCLLGQCTADKCETGYHRKSETDNSVYTCVLNTNYECGKPEKTEYFDCSEIENSNGICGENGKCECEPRNKTARYFCDRGWFLTHYKCSTECNDDDY